VPGPYTPPQPRRTQVVRSRRGSPAPRWRWWWLVPAVGLVPLIAAVLATQGAFNATPKTSGPVAAAPTQAAAAPTVAVVAVTTSTSPTTTVAAATPATAATAAATTASNAGGAAASPTAVATATAGTAATASISAATGSANAATASANATTASATATNATSGSEPFVAYRVQPGDTVRFIARTYGVSTASIVQASGLSNPDYLRVGQVLTIPARPGWLYRVQPGETLDQIAARTGVATDRIASASGLSIASVGPGSVLLIPDQAAAGPSK
jgi:LysM repeat protein